MDPLLAVFAAAAMLRFRSLASAGLRLGRPCFSSAELYSRTPSLSSSQATGSLSTITARIRHGRCPLLDEITDEDASLPIYEYPHERLAASQFLRDVIPAHCLAYLRFLELVFPPYLPPSWPQAHTPAMQDWWATVDWLQDKVNAPGLTLRLVVAEPGSEIAFDIYRRLTTQSEGHLVSKSYYRLVCPLTLLVDKGLARFYAKVVFSESWTKDLREYPTTNWNDWADLWTRDTKRRIERLVMGSRYESMYANNKAEPAASHWEYFYQQV